MYLAGVHRRRLRAGGRLRVRLAARTPGPLRADGARRPARRSPRSPRRCRSSSATGRARGREDQPIKLAAFEGLGETTQGRARAPARLVRRRGGEVRDRGSRSSSRSSPSTTRTRRWRGWTPCPADDRPPVNVVRFAFQTMVGIGTLLALLGVVYIGTWLRQRRLPRVALVLPRSPRRGPLSVVALICRLGHDRGRPPAVGRLQRHAHVRGRDRRGRHPGRLRDAGGRLPGARRCRRLDPAALGRASTRRRVEPAEGAMQRTLTVPAALHPRRPGAYAVLGGADFGAGLWQLCGGRTERDRAIREHAHHAMGPVWEANHVWLIFVLVVCWTAYPTAFGSIASTLSIPLFIAASRDHPARHGLRVASPAPSTPREQRAIEITFARLVDPDPVRARRRDRRDRFGPCPGRQRGGRPRDELAQPDLDPRRRPRRRDRRLPGGRLPRCRRRPDRSSGPRCGVPRPRARSRGRAAGASRSAGSRSFMTTLSDLGWADQRRRSRRGDRVGARRRRDDVLVWCAASSRRA